MSPKSSLWIIPALLTGIALLSIVASEAGEVEDLSAELRRIGQLSSRAEPACPDTAPENGRVTVIFEGTKGYCPKKALTEFPVWNDVESLEMKVSDVIERAGRSGTLPKDILALKSLYRGSTRGEGGFAHACYLQGGLSAAIRSSEQSAAAAKVAVTAGSQDPSGGVAFDAAPNLIYYSKNGAETAAKCVLRLSEKHSETSASPLRVSIIGYSMGGAAAVEFVKLVESPARFIDQVISVDPVGMHGQWVDSVLRTRNNPRIKRSPSVRSWMNFYQKQDFRALSKGVLVDVGIRGSTVKNADLNQEFGAEAFPEEDFWKTPHRLILFLPAVQEAMSRLVWGR